MKNILLITFLFVSLLSRAQGNYGFPNAGMENWTNTTTITDWILTGGSILRVDHVKHGAFAAALKNELASSGKLVTSFPFTAKVLRVFFDYKFVSGSSTFTDTSQVDIVLSRWNTGTSTRDVIARIIRNGIFTDLSWQTFSYPFTYFSALSPDSCFITIRSSINTGYSVNSVLNIDNFALQAPVGIESPNTKNMGTSIYPNPVKNDATLTYELKKDSRVIINVSDITGKVVTSINFEKVAGIQKEQLNFENFKSGIYFYEIKTTDEVKTGKFTISK